MNGQEKGGENFQAFVEWVKSKSDSDFREMVLQGRLNRGEICREIGFGRSVLAQNPRVKVLLQQLEDRLRASNILPVQILADSAQPLPLRATGQLQLASDGERLKKLEAENAGLRAELADLRQKLRRFETVEAVLAETGRLPR